MKKNKINFKSKKYIFPLIFLPFIIFIGYQIINFIEQKESQKEEERQKELSISLGEVRDSILNKNAAYDEFYKSRENRTMITNLEKEQDSLLYYSETLDNKQKRLIDSIENEREKAFRNNGMGLNQRKSYYTPNSSKQTKNVEIDEDEREYQRQVELIKMLNGTEKKLSQKQEEKEEVEEKEVDPLRMMKEQMLFMDSIERARNPELKAQMEAQNILKRKQAKMEEFLNSTFNVSKKSNSAAFNHISKEKTSNLIKAVIDENIKGYLGSRIRIRLLEDVFVGNTKMPKGTVLYALISGFGLQRVNLNIVSVMLEGEIFPINLSVYDNDGMKGLYVPRSAFREMMREIGSNTNYLQGSSMQNGNQNFYASLISGVINSASQTIAKVIRSNKVRLKYNSFVYLVDEKELKNKLKK